MAVVAKYTRQIVVLVTEETGNRIDVMAEVQEESVSEIIRRALTHGLPKLEAEADAEAAKEASYSGQ